MARVASASSALAGLYRLVGGDLPDPDARRNPFVLPPEPGELAAAAAYAAGRPMLVCASHLPRSVRAGRAEFVRVFPDDRVEDVTEDWARVWLDYFGL